MASRLEDHQLLTLPPYSRLIKELVLSPNSKKEAHPEESPSRDQKSSLLLKNQLRKEDSSQLPSTS